jgi:uncharacterized protein (TIGR02246 family)
MQSDTVVQSHSPVVTPLPNGSTAGDEAAIRDLLQQLLDAWGRGDGRTYGSLFTEEAEYVAFDGSMTRGARAITEIHQQLFDTWLKGTRLVGQIDGLRFLAPDVVLVHASGGTIFPKQKDGRGRRPSIQTLVAVKQDGAWKFTAFQNTRIVHRNKLQWILYGILSPIFER